MALGSWTQVWYVDILIRLLEYGSNIVHDAPPGSRNLTGLYPSLSVYGEQVKFSLLGSANFEGVRERFIRMVLPRTKTEGWLSGLKRWS